MDWLWQLLSVSRYASPDHTPGADLTVIRLAGSRRTTSHLKTCLIEASDLSKIEGWKPKTGEWSNRVSSVTNENREWLKGMYNVHPANRSTVRSDPVTSVWELTGRSSSCEHRHRSVAICEPG